MAANDVNAPFRRDPTGTRPSSSASTWYLVTGAAVLLTVLYMLTTGMMRPMPEEGLLSAPPVVTQP